MRFKAHLNNRKDPHSFKHTLAQFLEVTDGKIYGKELSQKQETFKEGRN